jgi:hypothetical protein
MSRVVLSLAAAGACAAATLLLAAPVSAGDYGSRHHDSNVWRDGNVFYNAYNSYDGYYRHNRGLGYWERPSDRYNGYRSWGSHYGYRDEGYGYGDRDDSYDDEGYGDGDGYGGRDRYRGGHGGAYYPGYGWYQPRHGARRFGCGEDRDCDGDGD